MGELTESEIETILDTKVENPKSINLSNKKFKESQCLEQQQGCQTLRNFLKFCRYKLTNELIPYGKLLQTQNPDVHKMTKLEKNCDTTLLDDKLCEIIKHKIISIENKLNLKKK